MQINIKKSKCFSNCQKQNLWLNHNYLIHPMRGLEKQGKKFGNYFCPSSLTLRLLWLYYSVVPHWKSWKTKIAKFTCFRVKRNCIFLSFVRILLVSAPVKEAFKKNLSTYLLIKCRGYQQSGQTANDFEWIFALNFRRLGCALSA